MKTSKKAKPIKRARVYRYFKFVTVRDNIDDVPRNFSALIMFRDGAMYKGWRFDGAPGGSDFEYGGGTLETWSAYAFDPDPNKVTGWLEIKLPEFQAILKSLPISSKSKVKDIDRLRISEAHCSRSSSSVDDPIREEKHLYLLYITTAIVRGHSDPLLLHFTDDSMTEALSFDGTSISELYVGKHGDEFLTHAGLFVFPGDQGRCGWVSVTGEQYNQIKGMITHGKE